MSTCTSCIHYQVCCDSQGQTEYRLKDIAANDVEIRCPNFKDVELVFDLPCKVGAKVYILNHKGPIYANPIFNSPIWTMEVTGFHHSNIGKKRGSYLLCGIGVGGTERINFDRIGKDVFFSEEEIKHMLETTGGKIV